MALVSGNECALLGLLAQRPRYGYELDKIIEEKLFREWTDIAFSSIYAILRGMEKKGLVESKSEIAGNRVRRQYAVTRAGRKALRATVESMIAEPAKTNDEFLTGLANIKLLEGAESSTALESRRQRLSDQLENIAKARQAAPGKKIDGLEPMLKRTELRVKADIDFIDWYLREEPVAEAPQPRKPEVKPEAPKVVEPETKPEESAEPAAAEESAEPAAPEEPRQTLF